MFMNHISIRDLQISAETIGALSGPTAVKSGNRTVGLLVPLKAADPDRLAAVLAAPRRWPKDAIPRQTMPRLLRSAKSTPAIGRSRPWARSLLSAGKDEATVSNSIYLSVTVKPLSKRCLIPSP
jgi:hypothetical protein